MRGAEGLGSQGAEVGDGNELGLLSWQVAEPKSSESSQGF